jgi:predicted Zn-dependent peptidase
MAKAHIKKPDGTSILIEGTPQEVIELVNKIEGKTPIKRTKQNSSAKHAGKTRASLPDLLISLVDGGFFKKPKELAAVKTALAELGHVYPVTTVSPALLRLVQRRHLRRIKQDSRWFYTG